MESTKAWDRYQKGLSYNSKIGLLAATNKNERFYAGRQWEGIQANGLPTPILNVTKRITDYKISAVMSDLVTMQFSADGVSDNDPAGQAQRGVAKLLSQYSRTLWERLKVDGMNENGLLDATLSGDMVSHWYYREEADDITGELIDGADLFLGDPNTSEINDAYGPVQPFIQLSFRRNVEDVRSEAKKYGASEEDILLITSDTETENRTGDRSKIELEDDMGKCMYLLEYRREIKPPEANWRIMAEKSTRSVVVRKWDTELSRYPVALFNWYKRKSSAHGEAEVTSLIQNQMLINKQAAMIALWIQLHGFPKVLYDKARIGEWTNDMSKAVPINGVESGGVAGAAAYMQPAQISAGVMQFMTWFIQITKDMAGANDAALGEANPTNTSAIIVLQKATAIPLSSVKRRFYQYTEDIGLIWLDFWMTQYTKYGERNLEITVDNAKQVIPLDIETLKSMKPSLKIDVGPSTQWNEATAVQTLDNLLVQQKIEFIEYLKRLPNGLIPDKQGLIDDRESQKAAQEKADKQLMYELMARFVDTLPPETLKQLDLLKQNDPAQYEEQVKQLIKQTPAQTQQTESKGPSRSINFKDLPPEGQVQLAEQAGIQLTPQEAAQNQQKVGEQVAV